MKKTTFMEIQGGPRYYGVLAFLGAFILAGFAAFVFMEHNGHWVTGMTNQVVWGTPHVFAIFMIVAASGALNVASIASVFGKTSYKPLAPLSGLMAISLLIGGLMVLVLDLGHPDRLIVAMTHYNFKSIFAWNMILYNGFLAIVIVYLWTMMQRSMNKYSKVAGFFAFIWRLALTIGTGSIFGFIVARQYYDAAIMAPMFVIMSFSFGLAFMLIVLLATYKWTGREIGSHIVSKLQRLQGLFVAAVLLFVVIFHLTNLYATQHHGVEHFILEGNNIYSGLFWVGYVMLGTVLPLIICYAPAFRASIGWTAAAAVLVIAGGLSQMYMIIIGGQAFPMDLFPGKEVSSSFYDGVVATYSPTAPEVALGLGGTAVTFVAIMIAIKVLRFLPLSLANADTDPHHKA